MITQLLVVYRGEELPCCKFCDMPIVQLWIGQWETFEDALEEWNDCFSHLGYIYNVT